MIVLLRAVSRYMARMPLERALAVGRFLGRVYGSALRYHRADAVEAIMRSLDADRAEAVSIADRMYAHLGMNVVESLRLIDPSETYLREYIEWSGEDNLREALGRGRGVFLLTAHVGNWEMTASLMPWKFQCGMHIIAKPIRGKALQQYLEETRGRFGMRVLPAKGAYKEILQALKRNEVVGFVLDQNMIRREGVFVDFFGRPACTTPGLAHLAAKTGAAVLPGFAVRLPGGRHRVEFLPPIDPPPDCEESTRIRATQAYTKLIEDHIRQYPDQWIWLHRRWKTTPDSLDTAYTMSRNRLSLMK